MWFDASAALSELGEGCDRDAQPPATIATPATPRARVAIVADVATPPERNRDLDHSRHGASIAGNPLTWTGRVVSLDEWRRLSDWEKHEAIGKPGGRLND